MAHSLSAKKRIRQNETRRVRNRALRSTLKTQIRGFQDALAGRDTASAEGQMKKLVKALDQTAAKGTIHKKEAARRKSRLQKRLNALKAAPVGA